MLKGILKVVDKKQMNRFHTAALQVLEKTGMQIHGKFLLQALADAGCNVDFSKNRVWFKPDLVEKQIKAQRNRYRMVRSSLWYPFCKNLPENEIAFPDEFTLELGHATPWIYDYPEGKYRKPTVKDQVDVIKLGNAIAEVKAVCAPFICSDFDPRMEIIESSRLLLLNTRKPGWVGTSNRKEVKYLAEFAALATDGNREKLRTMPPVFVHAYCTTSPLKLDTRSCEVLEEAIKYNFPVNFAPMPIMGGTTPITPAGSVVIAAAEILGCITAASLVAPDAYYYATSITGEMDMKTTQVCYATPGAILADAALHQLFRWKYGIVLNVEPAYVEAKCPGIQAAALKLFRQMSLGCTVSMPLAIGLLDNGSVFSAAQAMLDMDMNRALYGFAKGIKINDETLCVDLINEMEFCESNSYLQTDHTAKHFRDVIWDAKYFDRAYRHDETIQPNKADTSLLDAADREWRRLVAEQQPLDVDPKVKKELDTIVTAAQKEIIGLA